MTKICEDHLIFEKTEFMLAHSVGTQEGVLIYLCGLQRSVSWPVRLSLNLILLEVREQHLVL